MRESCKKIMIETKRKESEIFHELSQLCISKGYIHVIAYFCFTTNTISYEGELKVDDLKEQYSNDKLIRTEISTLIGLMCKSEIDLMIPKPNILQNYIDETEKLLEEIHHSMILPFGDMIKKKTSREKDINLFQKGSYLREAIFYGGESAYDFQYLDFSIDKYRKDDDWFSANKGFSIKEVEIVINTILNHQFKKLNNFQNELININPNEWTTLNLFSFKINDIITQSKLDKNTIENILQAFSFPLENKNSTFVSLSDFNMTNAYPILKYNDSYLLLQHYSLLEALYETPFFWFNEDESYKNMAMKHRAEFTEEFSAECLKKVFGHENVFTNIDIYKNKKNKAGEIDVLVIFADRAIIVQAKSKKLTIESRKGNDNALNSDFKKAIQDSYEQGKVCANLLGNEKYKLFDANSNELLINRNYKEVYIFCVISDHYPALAFQTDQFLKYNKSKRIKPPFIMDIFLLDVMTEMLSHPLYFLSYINRRVKYFKKINAQHELVTLSYHLKKNLFMSDEFTMMMLSDDIAMDLDQAMVVRRKGLPGQDTPTGILTKFNNTIVGNIITDIILLENSYTIELGFLLLQLSEDAIEKLNSGIKKIINLHKVDAKSHDFTIGFDKQSTGLTIHCNNIFYDDAYLSLLDHCKHRKYKQKVNNWFGLCIDPITKKIRFGVMSDKEWNYSDEMEISVKNRSLLNRKKIGRNEVCPCGSGKKYKTCCMK